MNPLRGAAWRARTFLSEPVHAAELATAQRNAVAEGAADARHAELVALLEAARVEAEAATRENRRLYATLREVLEEHGRALESLRDEVERMRSTT